MFALYRARLGAPTWCLLLVTIVLNTLSPFALAAHTHSSISTRADFDAFVTTWKKENPQLAGTFSAQDYDEIWLQFSGGSKSKSPPNTLLVNSSTHDVVRARSTVRSAIQAASKFNKEHTEVHRNSYKLKPDAQTNARARAMQFEASDKELHAAALVAEADAKAREANGTLHREYQVPILDGNQYPLRYATHQHSKLSKRDDSYWLAELGAKNPGWLPYGDNEKNPVFRNVMDFGAKGDGTHDDTIAILFAIYGGSRCKKGCGGSTVQGATVYFPPGTYLVSQPVIALYNTQLVGHPTNLPIIRAAASFTGLGVFTSDVYIENGNGESWYLNTANFLRQIRNFIIDTKDVEVEDLKVVHWQVAQATSLQNIHLYMKDNSSQIGFFIENGSGGTLDSLSATGGAIGINCGNQQFTSKKIVLSGMETGISMLWDWGWTWQGLIIISTKYGIRFETSDFTGGSLVVLDSTFYSVQTGIAIDQKKQALSLSAKNIMYLVVDTLIRSKQDGVVLKGGSGTLDNWILGTAFGAPDYTKERLNGKVSATSKVPDMAGHKTSNGTYLIRDKPQYEDIPASSFLNVGDYLSKHRFDDGKTDATALLSFMVLFSAKQNKVLFIPTGSSIITRTLKIPAGAKIVDLCWSQLVASGETFADMNNPVPMIQLGETGDIGSIELSDLLFTVKGPTAGVTLVEWNLSAAEQGGAAMWDCHFRVGGAAGSELQKDKCPKLTGSVNPDCIAASMLLHLTRESDAYLDNVWAWTADHDLDDPPKSETQIDVYSARGILIESYKPTWLYGTSSEHNVLYQYALSKASRVYMGMIQTESPYFLPHPPAPKPFESTIGKFSNDPDFKNCKDDKCRVSWALYIIDSVDIFVAGAGLYSWFYGNYDRGCVATQSCQQSLVYVNDKSSVIIYSLYTIGSKEMVNQGHQTPAVIAKDNIKINQDPYVSIIAVYNKRQANFLGSGGIFFEGGPEDTTFGSCASASLTGTLNLIDWWFNEKFTPDPDQHWETQFFHLFAGDEFARTTCTGTYTPDECDVTPECHDDLAATKPNYANAVQAAIIVSNFFKEIVRDRRVIQDVIFSEQASLEEDIRDRFPVSVDDANDALTKAFQMISKAIGVATWGADKSKRTERVGGYLGEFGTIFDFATSFIDEHEQKEPDIEKVVNSAISNFTDVLQVTVIDEADHFYGTEPNISHWPRSIFPKHTPYDNPVPNFLADGRYVQLANRNDSVFRSATKKHVRSSMAAIALMAENYYVIADAYYKPDCNVDGVKPDSKFKTARWIDGHCYALHKPGIGWQRGDVYDPTVYSEEMAEDKISSLANFTMDLNEVYRSSINCQEKSNKYYYQMPQDEFNLGMIGSSDPVVHSCLYFLPVIYVKVSPATVPEKTPCLMVNGTGGRAGHDYLPTQLQKGLFWKLL